MQEKSFEQVFFVGGKKIIVFVDKSLKWKFADNFFL